MQSNLIKLINFILLVIFCLEISAQTDSTSFDFGTPDEMSEIPDSLLNEDAVIVLREIDLANTRDFSLRYYKAIHKRIKILTQYGLDDYAQLTFKKYNNQELTRLKVRCIKPDRIIEIDSTDIFTETHSHSEFMSYDLIKLAVPGVEIGDEIEYIVIFKNKRQPEWGKIYFHDEYPVMESKVNLIFADPGMRRHIMAYNNVPKPINDSIIGQTFKLLGLRGIKTQDYAIQQNELPYIYFVPTVYYMNYNDNYK